MTETKQRLISADSHVLVKPDDVRARLPQRLVPDYDNALAAQAASRQRAAGRPGDVDWRPSIWRAPAAPVTSMPRPG